MPKKTHNPKPSSPPPKPRSQARRSLSLVEALAFLSLALLWCQAGLLTPEVSRPLGGGIWLIAVLLAVKEQKWVWLAASAALLFNPWVGAVHRGAGLYLLALLPWAGGLWGNRWMGAAGLAALGGWIWSQFPGLWIPWDNWVAGLSGSLSAANLSGAAAGWPLLGLGLCFPLAAIIGERRLYPHLAAMGGLIAGWLIYLSVQRGLETMLHRLGIHGQHDGFSMQWMLLILLGMVLFFWGYFAPPREIKTRSKKTAILISALIFVGALIVGWPPGASVPNRSKEVVFYNKGYLNWDVPKYGLYGQHSGGMFGLIPDYLSWRGFHVVKKDTLSAQNLSRAGVVVFINLMDSLSSTEERAVWDFVQGGGSVLLLGDHTGLAHIREPSNRLLKPYGIELNFDSAKPQRTGWAGSLVCAPHPLTAGWNLDRLSPSGNEAATQIWIGASLSVAPPAQPLIVGREGYSDLGNEKNEKDGFLGDFRYRTNERLGNMTLVAQAAAGQGKVLVFGDTSTLQNGALVRAGEWVASLFDWLLAPQAGPPAALRILGILLLLIGVCGSALLGMPPLALTLGAVALFLGAGISQMRWAATLPRPQADWTEKADPRVQLDFSHAPRTVLNQVSADGVWGLQNCLMRSKLLPQAMLRWDENTLRDAQALIEIAPAEAFSRKQQTIIKSYMERGGLVLWCCGMEEFDGSKGLLKSYGVEPLYVPLGPAQIKTTVPLPSEHDSLRMLSERELTVNFHKAWEVRVSNPQARIMLEGYDKPLILFIPVGQGGLLYIPDTDFLMNRNLESPSDKYYEDNILFLRYLLRELGGGDRFNVPP